MMKDHSDLCVGIDLGTTNSVLATINTKGNGDIVSKVVDIPRAVDTYNTITSETKLTTEKKPTLPSFVYYRQEKNYQPLVGDFAKKQYHLRPYLVAKSIKSQMGNPYVEGLSPDIPDKTPAQVSSNILKHLISQASKIYRQKIDDVVITVPANFDAIMCKATRDAAKLAGIKVENEDGSERPILLPEPNAVIYDLINQIHNGEISNHILDLSTEKNVLVFDLGGGTLDITMHKIKRRDECSEIVKVSEIATNRYTLLGGDDFDEEIAEEMFRRYISQYSKNEEIVKRLKNEKNMVMPSLRNYAEQLKIDLNSKYSEDFISDWDDSGWEDEDDDTFSVGGYVGGSGYSYEDTFTKEEVEKILSTFMGNNLSLSNYKNIEDLKSDKDTKNIIYPILDVLNKASKKLNVDNVKVDEVIMNGGMSKFYMVKERLKKFFNLEPISVLDPDQAVARGAAVYHYYLHKYEEIKDDMRLNLITENVKDNNNKNDEFNKISEKINENVDKFVVSQKQNIIEWGNNILNESLYLGIKNGGVHKIIEEGEELPYESELQTGFKISLGQSIIAIPIKRKNLDGSYKVIANGKIEFKKNYMEDTFVSFLIYMNSNKVITMKAWTSFDEEGKEKIEEGNATIDIEGILNKKINVPKISAPKGSILKPMEEINNLMQLCRNLQDLRKRNKDIKLISKKVASQVSTICSAGNPEEFAETILYQLNHCERKDSEAKLRLFIIAKRMGVNWDEKAKKKLKNTCLNQLGMPLNGYSVSGQDVSINIQAIYTLSICGEKKDLEKLETIHKSPYLEACLYTHGKTRSQINWLCEEFYKDCKKAIRGVKSNLQFSAYSIGIALRKDEEEIISKKEEEKIVKILCNSINSKKLSGEELVSCIIALGEICDQRVTAKYTLSGASVNNAYDTINNIEYNYKFFDVEKAKKPQSIALKMISGITLNQEEEKFLLEKLEE